MEKLKLHLSLAAFVCLALIVSSCVQNKRNQEANDSLVPTLTLNPSTVTPRPPTATNASVLTTTADPRIVPETRIIPTTTTTATSIPPTLTPIPKLSTEQAQSLVLDLLKNNAGCELPCYWGITPGETSWQTAHNFLASIAERVEQMTVNETTPDGNEHSVLYFRVWNSIPRYDDSISSGYRVINETIEKISVSESGTELRYQLHQVLGRYGMPDEVLLFLNDVSPSGSPWFSMYVIYAGKGMTFYYSHAAQMKGDALQVCPSGVGPEISLIKSGSLTLRQLVRDIKQGTTLFDSINDFPGKNIEYFYDHLKEPSSCITFSPND